MHLDNPIAILLLQVAVILTVARLVGLLFRYLHQPQVMGEMIAGIMLGPSLFGLLMPGVAATVFPPESIPALNILSQVGIVLFLFLIGLELDPKLLRNRGHAAIVISHVSIVAPFLLGAGLTLYLYPLVFNDAPRMRFQSAALFMGAAMSITAFPVLARILTERNLHKTKVGAVTITCAAVDDVTAWCMLAFVIAIARADGIEPAMITAILAAIYIAAMFLLVRPLLQGLQTAFERRGGLSTTMMAIVLVLVLSSAVITELIGIHALFGAFVMGAIMPKGTQFVRALTGHLEQFTVVLLLPIFFAYTGLQTQIGLLDSAPMWGYTALIILVACAGKFGGSTIAGRACGLEWREASAVGILMNTRGLMELVILNIGLKEGVITHAVFAMMVIMALVTTAMTTPLLAAIYPARLFGAVEAAAKRPRRREGFSVLVPISLPESGPPLARVVRMLSGDAKEEKCKLIAIHLRRPDPREALLEEPPEQSLAMVPLLEEAKRMAVPTESVSFVTRDLAADICEVASGRDVSLVLMGFHKPIFGTMILGGTVHRVLSSCQTDVAIFVDRGLVAVKEILVPFMGSPHDRLSVELAARMARSSGATLTVLHVLAPQHEQQRSSHHVRAVLDDILDDDPLPAPVNFRVIHDASPVDAVLRETSKFDLVVVGVDEQWGLESHLFGFRPQRIASECRSSMLIVRNYQDAHDSERSAQQPAVMNA
jgi:Kef-type K+ transport system membrane component KefB